MITKVAILMRHAESEKVVGGRFSHPTVADRLTDRGVREATSVARYLDLLRERIGEFDLVSADSERARETAHAIAEECGVITTLETSMTSLQLGRLGLLPEEQIKQTHPDFWRDLSLYRAGLMNSYNMSLPQDAENQMQFEVDTFKQFEEILAGLQNRLAVFVLHRSPITALSIAVARSMGIYPNDFFGHVPIEPCHSMVIIRDLTWKLVHANVAPECLDQAVLPLLSP